MIPLEFCRLIQSTWKASKSRTSFSLNKIMGRSFEFRNTLLKGLVLSVLAYFQKMPLLAELGNLF